MLEGYRILTLTHRHAALEEIGGLTLNADTAAEELRALRSAMEWDELFCVNTCNRALFVFYVSRPDTNDDAAAKLIKTLRPEWSEGKVERLSAKMRLFKGADAVRHLYEVASSMDSLVLGEREIIRQLRAAYAQCREWALTGDHLRLLMNTAVETAKAVYSGTGIGEKSLSVVALAFEQMRLSGIGPKDRIVLAGAGQTNALYADFLKKYGFQDVVVFNRSIEKAETLAAMFDFGRAYSLSQLPGYKEGFDALIVCTGATEAIITPAIYESLLNGENGVKTVVDLSVPNNVAREVTERFPLNWIEIEGLREIARLNLSHREQERQKAETIITEKVKAFRYIWHERQVERSLAPMIAEIKTIKTRAVELVFQKEIETLDANAKDLVFRMLDYMEKKSVAIPVRAMKSIAANVQQKRAHSPAPTPV